MGQDASQDSLAWQGDDPVDNRKSIYSCPWMLVGVACLVLLTIGVIGLAPPLAAEGEPPPAFESGQVLVKLSPSARNQPDVVAARHGASMIADLTAGWYLMGVPTGQEQAAIADFSTDSQVEAAELNYRVLSTLGQDVRPIGLSSFPTLQLVPAAVSGGVRLAGPPNDVQYPLQWNLVRIRVARAHLDDKSAWDYTTGSASIMIAILGTGVDRYHPDLAGKLLDGWDFVNNDDDPSEDSLGLGTMQAGIAAAVTNNQLGIAGVSWGARLLPVKVIGADNVGKYATIVQGIRWAVDHKANIINMSFSGPAPPSLAMQEAMQYAIDKGVLPVASVGDTSASGTPIPAALDGVLGVTGTDQQDVRLSSTATGPYVDVAAPGEDIVGTYWVGNVRGYALGLGTEFAAPQVSGVAALILSMNPYLTPLEVTDMIAKTARDLGPAGPDQEYGYGLVDAEAAVRRTPHYLQVNHPSLLFFREVRKSVQPTQHTITNTHSSRLSWTITTTASWLTISRPSANVPSTATIAIAPGYERGCGSRSARVYITSRMEYPVNSPITVDAVQRFNQPCAAVWHLPWVARNQPTGQR